MAQNSAVQKLKAALMLTIIFDLFYGVGLFVVPGLLSAIAGGTPVEHGWIRWAGGVLIGLAVGAMQAYRNPAGQRSIITLLTMTSLLAGLAFVYTLLFETYSIHTWFIVVPCVGVFVIFAALLWARQGAKEILV